MPKNVQIIYTIGSPISDIHMGIHNSKLNHMLSSKKR